MVAPVFEALCGLDERFTPKSPSGRRFARAASRSSEETVKCRSAGWVLVASTSLRTGAPVWEQPPAGAPARLGRTSPGSRRTVFGRLVLAAGPHRRFRRVHHGAATSGMEALLCPWPWLRERQASRGKHGWRGVSQCCLQERLPGCRRQIPMSALQSSGAQPGKRCLSWH